MDFVCNICETTYKNETGLKRHFKTQKHLKNKRNMKKTSQKSNNVSAKEKKKKTPGESIYLIREREFIRLNEPTYKIGRTSHKTKHPNYPKGSELIISFEVTNSRIVEKKLIAEFQKKFTQKVDYGDEYFNGNIGEMVLLMQKHSTEEKNSPEELKNKNEKEGVNESENEDETEKVTENETIKEKITHPTKLKKETYHFYLFLITRETIPPLRTYKIGFTNENLERLRKSIAKKYEERHSVLLVSYKSLQLEGTDLPEQDEIRDKFYQKMKLKYSENFYDDGYITSEKDLLFQTPFIEKITSSFKEIVFDFQ
jgi:hypothetical protein